MWLFILLRWMVNFPKKEVFPSSRTAFHALKSNTSKAINAHCRIGRRELYIEEYLQTHKSLKVFHGTILMELPYILRLKEICFHIHLDIQSPEIYNSFHRTISKLIVY